MTDTNTVTIKGPRYTTPRDSAGELVRLDADVTWADFESVFCVAPESAVAEFAVAHALVQQTAAVSELAPGDLETARQLLGPSLASNGSAGQAPYPQDPVTLDGRVLLKHVEHGMRALVQHTSGPWVEISSGGPACAADVTVTAGSADVLVHNPVGEWAGWYGARLLAQPDGTWAGPEFFLRDGVVGPNGTVRMEPLPHPGETQDLQHSAPAEFLQQATLLQFCLD